MLLDEWLEETLGRSADILPSLPLLSGAILAEFGRDLFRRKHTLNEYSAALLALQDRCMFLRGNIKSAWDLVRTLVSEVPCELTAPCPEILLKSVVVVSILWQWGIFGASRVHNLSALHRQCELRYLKRRAMQFAKDRLDSDPILFARVARPKTAWVGPKVQYTELDDPLALHLLSALFLDLPLDAVVYGFSSAQERTRWETICAFIGVFGLQARSLRGGGTVWAYRKHRSLNRVLWQGRWTSVKNLTHYLQDGLGRSTLQGLSDGVRERLLALERLYPKMIARF